MVHCDGIESVRLDNEVLAGFTAVTYVRVLVIDDWGAAEDGHGEVFFDCVIATRRRGRLKEACQGQSDWFKPHLVDLVKRNILFRNEFLDEAILTDKNVERCSHLLYILVH